MILFLVDIVIVNLTEEGKWDKQKHPELAAKSIGTMGSENAAESPVSG